MKHIICALCGKNQRIKVLYLSTVNKNINSQTYSARRLPDNTHFRIVKCKNCGLVFSSPIFSESKISNLYKKSLLSYTNQVPYLIKDYLGIFEKNVAQKNKNIQVLEIGCGDGFFLHALYKRGIKNVHGVEPSRTMVSQASINVKKNIKTTVFKKDLFPKNKFDVVCSFHTLDHVVNPNEFAAECFSLLKKNGFLIIVVHNVNGLFVKLLGRYSPVFDIEHIYLFNQKTLKILFQKHGFKKIKVFNITNTYPLSYLFRMSPVFPKVKNKIKFILDNSMLGKVPVSISAGNMCLIANK